MRSAKRYIKIHTKRHKKRHIKRKNKQKGGSFLDDMKGTLQSKFEVLQSSGSNYANDFKATLATNFSSLKSGVMGKLCGAGGSTRKHKKH